MKCSAKPGGHHLLVMPKFSLTIYDCQCQITNIITGSINLDVYNDVAEFHGLQAAKDGWWEFYLWLKEQEKIQNELSLDVGSNPTRE